MGELSSFGYFFNGNTPKNGKYLLLPNGHNAEDRIAVQEGAGTNYEYCALFYSSDEGKSYLPFSKRKDDPLTLVLDKNSRFSFWIYYETFEIDSNISLLSHYHDQMDYMRYMENIEFNKAKEWLSQNFSGFKIEMEDLEGEVMFRIGVDLDISRRYDVANSDLVKGIIQLYNELKID